mgnify:CR=1 FL=1
MTRKTDYAEYMSPEELDAEVKRHERWVPVLDFIHDCASVLDVGAGSGRLGVLLKEKRPSVKYIGLDIRPQNVEYMRGKGLTADVALAEDLGKFADKSFDAVVLAEVLEHLKYPGKAIAEAFRVGKKVVWTLPERHTDEWHRWLLDWRHTQNHLTMCWSELN